MFPNRLQPRQHEKQGRLCSVQCYPRKSRANPLASYRIFNTGSPWNVPAGHGGANLDSLIAHYEKKNADAEEQKMKTLKEGKEEPSPDLVRRGTY